MSWNKEQAMRRRSFVKWADLGAVGLGLGVHPGMGAERRGKQNAHEDSGFFNWKYEGPMPKESAKKPKTNRKSARR